jgi:hypothetical protein
MALGGIAGGAIGGKFDEPETTMKVNDFTIETNPNDKIGGVLDNTSVDKINSTLEALLSETRNRVKETKAISNMRVQLDDGNSRKTDKWWYKNRLILYFTIFIINN